ncbi:MAG TPA: cellulase family glycosylhydrolase [Devosia sp.]|nr:cellulase family glycosylhydrolase [Devosia sp.]
MTLISTFWAVSPIWSQPAFWVRGLAVILTALALAYGAPASAAPGFSVADGTIIGPDGKPFVARGVNVSGPNWVWHHKTAPDAALIADCWGFNLVRVNIFLFPETKYPQVDDNNDLDAIVQAFTSRGIVVVIEAHDRIGSFFAGADLKYLADWYAGLARKYRGNPYVWFDIMNEPGGYGPPDGDKWLLTHRTAIAAIRDTAGADNIILVEGTTWGQDTGRLTPEPVTVAESAILGLAGEVTAFGGKTYDNIVFSIHVYDMWNFPPAKLAAYIAEVKRRHLALLIGEYGSETDDGLSTLPATRAMFEVAVPQQVGRAVWHWDGGTVNTLTIGRPGGGWQIDSCTAPHNLTPLGQLVWNDNHPAGEPS